MPRRSSIASIVALAGALTLGGSAIACTVPPPTPPVINIIQIGPNTYCIFICNYTAAGAMIGNFCACALNALGPIQSVDDVTIYQSSPQGMGEPDPCNGNNRLGPIQSGWDFQDNLNTGIDFQNAAASGNWAGFLALTTNNIPGQLPVTIKFTVTTVPASTIQDLVTAIDAGDPLLVGVGKGDPAGFLMPAHTSIMPAGTILVSGASIPAMGVIGLAVCGTGLAAAGAFAIRRRNRLA